MPRAPKRHAVEALGAWVTCAVVALALAPPVEAATATSYGFVCNTQYAWVRANWPDIRTDTARLTPVYFRALLDEYTTAGWQEISMTPWYVGVSNSFGRKMLDSSLGALPYPFLGGLGHLFAYIDQNGSHAGPQLGPFFTGLRSAYYRTREEYWVNGVFWRAGARVNGTSYTSCMA
jgi:hypothetical protein